MSPPDTEDVILRECRRTLLARRLILHGVRTHIIRRLTGMTRARLDTLRRRRLMIPDKSRCRGPAKSALTVFLSEPLARAEGAAIAALFAVFEIPIEHKAPSIPKRVSFPFVERLCWTYEAYCACCPRTKVQLEEIISLRGTLARGDRIQLGKCRGCTCLLVIDRYDGSLECLHCGAPAG
jgi:hypothetical protein